MFQSVFFFEIRRWLRAPATYIYFGILLLIGFLFAIIAGGSFDSVRINFQGEKVFANAPVVVDQLLTGINSFIGLIIITAVIGNAVLTDFRLNTYSLLFTTPISKTSYLTGRFWGAFVVCAFVLMAPALGMMVGYAMPWLDAARIGPFVPGAYLNNYWQTTLPNAFFGGALFFAVSLISRDIFMIWISLILLFVALGVSSSMLSTLEKQNLAAMLNPFGAQAKSLLTKYWSVHDSNTKLIPLQGIFLYNRLVWVGVSIAIWIIGYFFFSFTSAPRNLFGRRKLPIPSLLPGKVSFQRIVFPKASLVFGRSAYLKNLWGLSVNECRAILRNVYFRIIMLFAMLMMFLAAEQIGKFYDTATFPVTAQAVQFLEATLHLFVVVVTIMFSGELIWRSRELRMNNILDALPVPNWVFYVSKLFALFFLQTLLACLIIVCGIIIQMFKGYFHFELLLYIKYIFGFVLIDYWLLAVMAMMVQVLANNKYVGYFITVLFYIWNGSFAFLVLKHSLFVYTSDPGYQYSDMNQFGHSVFPFFVFKLYWGFFAIALAILSSLLWPRGTEGKLKWRWKAAMQKSGRKGWLAIAGSLVLFAATGSYIYYNTNVLNKYRTDYQGEKEMAAFEKKYRKYLGIPQPKITDVKLDIDIYPDTRSLHASGTYSLKNKNTSDVTEIHLNLSDEIEYRKLAFSRPATLAVNDKEMAYRIYRLAQPLHPGDSMLLEFDLHKEPHGFTHGFSGMSMPNYNGTFLNNQVFLPSIGYSPDVEISDNNRRKKHGLGYRATSTAISDTPSHQRNLFIRDADFINFEVKISTAGDQLAIAPGYLQKEWTDSGRRHFIYKMDSPILNFYSFLSARYLVKKENWNGINLEIWYQKGHEYNLERMFNGMKKSLQYYTTNFTPYQHRQVRIVEFPAYSSFAQSFPNTIPFSESIGFIADVDRNSESDVDYPFYVTAHEVAHQWFAHQVVGADVEGSNMLSESLAQYGSIMVLQKEYGDKKIRKFLKYEMDNYLNSRSNESEKEKPLAYVDAGQGYILYQKGGIVFFGLSKYIGEDSLNHALSRFLKDYAFKAPPYPTTLDLVRYIRQSTPDSMQYFVTDAFEKIVFYDNRITTAKRAGKDTSNYNVSLTVTCAKTNADSTGKETPVAMNDYVEVGAYTKKGDLLKLERYKLRRGANNITISGSGNAHRIIIDPRHLLFDKKSDDNEKVL